MKKIINALKLIASLVILVTLLFFAYNNRYNMHLDLTPFASVVRIPAYGVIYITFVLGMITSLLLRWIMWPKKTAKTIETKKLANEPQNELSRAEAKDQSPLIEI